MTANFNKHFPWLKCFGFRKNPRSYEDHELIGNVALVIEVKKDYIRVITHNLHRVEILELMPEDFFKLFTMDPYLTPLASAKELRQAKNIMVMVPPSLEIIEQHIAKPNTLEEITPMTRVSTSKAAKAVQASARVCHDFNRRTCIEISRANGVVIYIPLATHGLELEMMDAKDFDEVYTTLPDYPAEKAAKLYAEYTQHLGATKDAMIELAKLTPILDKEIQMATAKKAANATAKAEKKPVAAKKTTAAKPAAKSAPAKKVATGEKKPSAANMFCELIMEGKLTDTQIFKKVQDKFGLDDKKASYVKWYRNHLTKQGKNPPAAKAEK